MSRTLWLELDWRGKYHLGLSVRTSGHRQNGFPQRKHRLQPGLRSELKKWGFFSNFSIQSLKLILQFSWIDKKLLGHGGLLLLSREFPTETFIISRPSEWASERNLACSSLKSHNITFDKRRLNERKKERKLSRVLSFRFASVKMAELPCCFVYSILLAGRARARAVYLRFWIRWSTTSPNIHFFQRAMLKHSLSQVFSRKKIKLQSSQTNKTQLNSRGS